MDLPKVWLRRIGANPRAMFNGNAGVGVTINPETGNQCDQPRDRL